MNTDNRISPQTPEIEEAILGACRIEARSHQLIYSAVLAMHQSGTKIDILTVKEELARRGKLEEVGGPYAIAQLSSRVASSAHIEYHMQDCSRKVSPQRDDSETE